MENSILKKREANELVNLLLENKILLSAQVTELKKLREIDQKILTRIKENYPNIYEHTILELFP